MGRPVPVTERHRPSHERFAFLRDFELPGFTYDEPPYGGLQFRFCSETSALAAFSDFADRIESAVGRSYLPVYRLADGEFAFMVSERTRPAAVTGSALRAAAGSVLRRLRGTTVTCWGERYAGSERAAALARFTSCLRRVAAAGVLAPYFARRPDRWGETYFRPVCDWLDGHDVFLGEDNYIPFYAVYALLNGPRRKRLYGGRRILVVTHLTETRERAIRSALLAEGARSVEFVAISASRSLFERIDAATIRRDADMALVAAGIGSVAVLDQLEPLSIPCIDCGITIECMIKPELRWERPFLIDDERSDPDTLRQHRRF